LKAPFVIAKLLGCAVFLLLPTSTRAEIVVAESIEWVLANSDHVIVGKVVKVDKVVGQDNKPYEAATVEVARTLKGAPADRVTFLLHNYNGPYAKQWMDEGIPILFCLVKNDGVRLPFPRGRFAWILREDGNHHDAILLGKSKHHWTGCIPVLTRDFKVLTEKDAILKHVQQAVKAAKQDRRLRSHTVDVPARTAVYKKLWSLSAVELLLPVDEELEALGRSWCKSESPYERNEGARILRHFKNAENIAILKSLLNDPNTSEATLHQTVPGKVELELVYRKKLYYVRQAAFAALQEFGVKVGRPVLEELLEGRDVPDPEIGERKRSR
jgi:hypothetical protein